MREVLPIMWLLEEAQERGIKINAKPSIMICSAGKNLSDPITFVGLCPMARDIVWPMAVIAPVTVGSLHMSSSSIVSCTDVLGESFEAANSLFKGCRL